MTRFARIRILIAAALLTQVATGARAEGAPAAWGPPVDAPLPLLSAEDQAGEPRSFANLAGRRGLLLFMNRSTDW